MSVKEGSMPVNRILLEHAFRIVDGFPSLLAATRKHICGGAMCSVCLNSLSLKP